MKIIHFCSYFSTTKVYSNFFNSLKKHNKLDQVIFFPYRKKNQVSDCFILEDIHVDKIKCLFWFTRIFYSLKVIFIFISAIKKYKEKKYDIVHAHTLYSDGVAAFLFSCFKKTSLVITVRNTDVNLGFKYFRHYKFLIKMTLRYAKKIIVVSPSYKNKIINEFGVEFADKIIFVPNGIDEYFVDNSKLNLESNVNDAIYVGRIDKNKNIYRSIMAYKDAMDELCIDSWFFYIIGGTYGDFLNFYPPLPQDVKENVIFLGKLDKVEVIEYFDKSSIFIMPSIYETFGLVYIEAISRCLPVVYSEGQGIDGVFSSGSIGNSCLPLNQNSIKDALLDIKNRFPKGLGPYEINPAIQFSWKKISYRFIHEIYLK